MSAYEKTVDVAAPVAAVYDQWCRFEEFPKFMRGVDAVEQLDDTHTHWSISLDGLVREFDAETTARVPGERVAWRSTSGPEHSGEIVLEVLDGGHTRVHAKMRFTPARPVEHLGAALGIVGARVRGDVRQFKEYVEAKDDPVYVSSRVPRALRDEVRRRAADDGRSEADLLSDALARYVERHGDLAPRR
jgi:uncharacterized membrane protein